MTAFKTSESYGNDLTIKVISRTAKTVTIETVAWGTSRVKIRTHQNGLEYISFKAWLIDATEKFDIEEARKIAYSNAYES